VEILHREAVHRSVIAQLLPRSGLTPLAESSELRMCDAMCVGTEHDSSKPAFRWHATTRPQATLDSVRIARGESSSGVMWRIGASFREYPA
jgi:hypothetical protein